MLAADTMEALGIPRGSYIVKVNNRKVLDGAMDRVHIPAEKRLTTMRAIDKLDRLGIDGVKMLLGKGRKDESGDFTKGAELLDSQIAGIVAAITGTSGHAGDAGTPGEEELSEIAKLVRAAGYDDRVRIDKTVVRGLEYYTGPVYEVELTFEIKDEKGRPVRLAPLAEADVTMGLCHVSGASRCPRLDFPLAFRAFRPHSPTSARSAKNRPLARWLSRYSTGIALPTTSAWSQAAHRENSRRALSRQSIFTAALARNAPRTSTEAIVCSASFGETSSAMVARPSTRICNVCPTRAAPPAVRA